MHTMWLHAVAVLGMVTALVMTPVGVAAQSTDANEVPRTSWGEPELTGIYDYSSITPMQRPEEYGDRQFLTDEEVAELEQAAVERNRARDEREVTRAEAGDAGGANSHSSVWGLDFPTKALANRRTSRIIDPRNGRFPPMTSEAQKISAMRLGFSAEAPDDDYTDRGFGDRCMAIQGMPLSSLPYNNIVQLFQARDNFVILAEAFRIWRIVPIDDRPHGHLRQWTGDARGHWQDDSLVVETTNFSHILQHIRAGRGIRKLVERFTRTSPDVVEYEFTVDDPTTWTAPWTATLSLRRTDQVMYEYACHEGNLAMLNILRAARKRDGTPDEAVIEPGKICWDCEP